MISNLPIIILKDNIILEIESKSIVVIPVENPVLEIVEAVSNTVSIKTSITIIAYIIDTYCSNECKQDVKTYN